MGYYTPMSRKVAFGVPFAALLLGVGGGWLTRDQSVGANHTSGHVSVGAQLPADLDRDVPATALPPAMRTTQLDPRTVIGLTPAAAITVPAGAAIDLPLGEGQTASPVDAATLAPAAATQPVAPATGPPILTDTVNGCADAPSSCAGVESTVRSDLAGASNASNLAPLQVSTAFAATGDVADLCAAIEGDTVLDPFLTPATRPTFAVVVNQPSTIALSGSWSDGAELKKLTMITSSAYDEEWQQTWATQHAQRNILACITIGLDEVRTHATGGRAELRVDALAISAEGRAQSTGEVVLNIPVDDPDPLFAERVVVTDSGERAAADGVLHPTVHVHYAVLTDALVPVGSPLTAATLHLTARHALVDGADCAGWAGNELGRDRASDADAAVHTEVRTIAGQARPVTVVDADVRLDNQLPGGWQGFACVQLTVSDATGGSAATLAVDGAAVRSPRTAEYTVGALLDDPSFPADWQLRVMWSAGDTALCTPALLDTLHPSATCPVSARLAPTGIVMSFVAVDARGADHPAMYVRLPVNTAYCDTDDPSIADTDGCDTGHDRPWLLSYGLPNGGTQLAHVVLHFARSAAEGSAWRDPSGAWAVGPVQPFA